MEFIPSKHSKCAVVIPYYKNDLKDIEIYCLEKSLAVIGHQHDVYFMMPLGLENGRNSDNFYSYYVSGNHLKSVETYCRFLLEPDLYASFCRYDKILILQVDAVLLRDDIISWASKDFDYIGAPWFDRLIFRPSFTRLVNPNASERLDVGNGGLCMINPRGFLYLQNRYSEIFEEFYKYTGPNAGQEALYSFLCREDEFLKVASRDVASLFSLELNAREQIEIQGVLPMGFHSLFKYDLDLWLSLFPDSPDSQ